MFDFDPEAYYPINDQGFSPTRPPRPHRPTRATFYRPPSTSRPHNLNHRPNHHFQSRPTSPPYTRPTRPPPSTRPPYRPKPEPVDFYPNYNQHNYFNPRPEENEVEDSGGDRQGLGHLSTASTISLILHQQYFDNNFRHRVIHCSYSICLFHNFASCVPSFFSPFHFKRSYFALTFAGRLQDDRRI